MLEWSLDDRSSANFIQIALEEHFNLPDKQLKVKFRAQVSDRVLRAQVSAVNDLHTPKADRVHTVRMVDNHLQMAARLYGGGQWQRFRKVSAHGEHSYRRTGPWTLLGTPSGTCFDSSEVAISPRRSRDERIHPTTQPRIHQLILHVFSFRQTTNNASSQGEPHSSFSAKQFAASTHCHIFITTIFQPPTTLTGSL